MYENEKKTYKVIVSDLDTYYGEKSIVQDFEQYFYNEKDAREFASLQMYYELFKFVN